MLMVSWYPVLFNPYKSLTSSSLTFPPYPPNVADRHVTEIDRIKNSKTNLAISCLKTESVWCSIKRKPDETQTD